MEVWAAQQLVDDFGAQASPTGAAQHVADLVLSLEQRVGSKADLADELLSGRKKRFGKNVGILGEDPIHQRVGEAFLIADGSQESPAMPGEQSQFQGSLVGHAAGPGLAGEDQAGDAGRIDAVVACLANLGVAASVGLEGIEDDGVIAAALEFCPRAHPVVAGGFHGNQHPAGSTGGAEHLVFQPIEALTRIGKGRQLGDDLALGRDGRGGMGSLAEVDADDGPALSQHGPSRTGVVHDSDSWERFCQRARRIAGALLARKICESNT